MIPKIIHYCWFGKNPLPANVQKCIESWKKYCPDFEIKRWDESNYDVNACAYTQEAYEAKKWAFVSDYARLDIIYNNGGIYLDTDVELIRAIDDELLKTDCFLAMEQPSLLIATGLGFGAVKHSSAVKEMLDEYKDEKFRLAKNIYDQTPCPTRNTRPFLKYGYTRKINTPTALGGAVIYPPEYFCPFERKQNKLEITDNTYSIHHYSATWSSANLESVKKRQEYIRTHSAFQIKIHDNLLECKSLYHRANPITLLRFLIYKIKKKILLRRTENLALRNDF